MNDNGGQAFPGVVVKKETSKINGSEIGFLTSGKGMSLRDYFAAKAMQGILSNPSVIPQPTGWERQSISESSYLVADAMLLERKKKK